MRRQVVAAGIAEEDFARRRNTWFAVTCLAFIPGNFWIFAAGSALVLWLSARRDANPFALYVFVLLAVPPIDRAIPGFGVINYVFELNYLRLLSLVILLPIAVRVRSGGWLATDYFLLGYIILQIVLRAPYDSATNLSRITFQQLIDVLLPYYVASRSVRSVAALKDVLLSFVVGASVVALVAMFETLRTWELYARIPDLFGAEFDYRGYLRRAGSLRAVASTGQAIVLGYVLVVAAIIFGGTKEGISRSFWLLALIILLGGAAASQSRGPLVGLAIGWVGMRMLGPDGLTATARLVVGAVVVGVGVMSTPIGPVLLEYVPFIGTIDDGSVSYRQQLFDLSLKLISGSPWFGVANFYGQLVDFGMVQGQGIVDLVNTYITVALAYGVIALALFIGAFASVLWPLGRLLVQRRIQSRAQHQIGAALFGALLAAMVIIATVASILVVPYIYWILTGLTVSYILICRRAPARFSVTEDHESSARIDRQQGRFKRGPRG